MYTATFAVYEFTIDFCHLRGGNVMNLSVGFWGVTTLIAVAGSIICLARMGRRKNCKTQADFAKAEAEDGRFKAGAFILLLAAVCSGVLASMNYQTPARVEKDPIPLITDDPLQDPNNPKHWEKRAREHRQKKLFQEADKAYTEAIALLKARLDGPDADPQSLVFCLQEQGLVRELREDWKGAVASLTESLQILQERLPKQRGYPEHIMMMRARSNEKLEKYDEVVADLKEAARLMAVSQHQDPSPYVELSLFYTRRGDTKSADYWSNIGNDIRTSKISFEEVLKLLNEKKSS
jgi:hypothetical protein